MPQLGETVSEGTVTRWLRKQGDTISADEPLLEIQTDKVSMEVPSLRGGVLVEILVAEGQTVPVGAALAWLETDGGENGSADPCGDGAACAVGRRAPPSAGAVRSAEDAAGARRPTPLVRRLLAEAGLRASDVTGSGPGGRLTRDDVAAAVAARSPAPAAQDTRPATATTEPRSTTPAGGGRTEPLSPLRKVIAERMVTSLRTSAQLTSVVEVDVTRIAALRRRAEGAPGPGGNQAVVPGVLRPRRRGGPAGEPRHQRMR